ncbi:glycosyl hydrolases family 31 domain-containing protein [Phthorimaea operculella]|nr:glycosyl hydrolases family 31 domain-containing protein [Phthorimaea operculella]
MNEPSNLITGQIYGGCEPLDLPYEPSWDNQLNKKTICMEAKHHIGRHYDVHNLYALYEAFRGLGYGGCEPLDLPYEPSWDNQLNKKTICMEAKHHIGRHYDVHNLYALYEAVATNFFVVQDMNEPSNLITGQIYGGCEPLDLPYEPSWDNQLNKKTICMEAKHHIGRHYDVHNLYALYEAVATNFALQEIRGKRPFIISRASFPGLGKYAGHWSGDIQSTWEDMRYSITGLLAFSLFGIPMMGADICGFSGDATPQLCKRWMQLGAFYPFSRNHADKDSKPQDPVSMGPEVVEASKRALRLRYKLIPYYYTLFWKAHTQGTTVATPLFFLAPDDPVLDEVDTQFLIGPHVMIAPILEQDANTTQAYFPKHKWYNLVGGELLAHDQHAHIDDQQTVAVRVCHSM